MSERIWRERWGSHWRWRWMLFVALVVLVTARVALGQWWRSPQLVFGGGGPPAVLLNWSSGGWTIETWDWSTNQTAKIVALARYPNRRGIICTGDRRVMWFDEGMLHSVELEPPHEQQQWATPYAAAERRDVHVVGTSVNSRFVAVECEHSAIGGYGPYFDFAEVAVIDRQTGEVVSNIRRRDHTRPTPVAGLFKDYRELWRLTDEGEWESVAAKDDPQPYAAIVVESSGKRYRLRERVSLKPQEEFEYSEVKALSPDGQHILLQRNGYLLLLAHEGNREVQVLPIATHYSWAPSFTTDSKHLVATDVYQDLHAFDATTGKIVASTRYGAHWHWGAGILSAACLGVAFSWIALAFRQQQPVWAVVDIHAAAMAAQMALFGYLLVMPEIRPEWLVPPREGTILCITGVFGIAVGWYWTYGRASLGARLKWGLLSILVIAIVPAVAMVHRAAFLASALLLPPFCGLFAACVTALALLPFSLLPWRVSDQSPENQARRFGLASMMLVVTGISVIVGFLNLFFLPSSRGVAAEVAIVLLPIAVLGLLWPAVVMMNVGRWWRIALGIGVAVLVVGGMVVYSTHRPATLSWHADRAAYWFVVTTGPLLLGMATLARKHGWRWRRAVQTLATSEDQSLEAAA